MSDNKIHSLAPVQRKTLDYLKAYIADKGYAPSLKEISEYIGVKSCSTAHFHLARLEDKGFIEKGEDGGISITDTVKIDYSPGDKSLPLLGLIAAGSPIEAIEDDSVRVEVPSQYLEQKGEVYCLQVTGDSMIDAHIADGDIIIVKKQETANDGDIVVAMLDDGTATLKTFRRHKGGKVMLIPHNRAYKPITLDSVTIQGKLIGLMREM